MFISKYILVLSFISLPFISNCATDEPKLLVDQIAINVKDTSRVFCFTNKGYSQFSGETNAPYSDGWHGWTFREQRIFNDLEFVEGDKKFDRKTATATVTPYSLVRDFGKANEFVFIPDSLDAVFVRFSEGNVSSLTLLNICTEKFIIKNGTIELSLSEKIPGYSLFIKCNRKIKSAKIIDKNISLFFEENDTDTKVLFIASEQDYSEEVFVNMENIIKNKKNRIETLLQSNRLETNNKDFNKAYLWSIASADALITEQQMKGIFAGLPWFNNYWGRDTYISLPGAAIIPGNLQDAKDILLSFAKYQNTDNNSKYYGRIPNRITLNEVIYNTADGTPRWVIQAYNYYKATADEKFLKQIAGKIKTAFNASMSNYNDVHGFLTHDDADTWMDAVGPDGPWSPRGNRANDIQALWYQQLDITEKVSYMSGDTITALRAAIQKQKLVLNFEKYFYNDKTHRIYDHLNIDGSPDLQIRPNIFTVLNTTELIPDYKKRREILLASAPELISRRGILSLSYKDVEFHPFHQYLPYYVKDAAYHNGIIWQWTSGPAISAMSSFGFTDSAWVLIEEQTHQLLNRWGVGTIAELSDAIPRENESEPRLSGTFAQAWSLAEYIRNLNEDFLGYHPDAPANTIYLLPSLPRKISSAEFTKNFRENTIGILYDNNNAQCRITVRGEKIDSLIDIGIALINYAGSNFQIKTDISQGDILTIEVPSFAKDNKNMKVYRNGSKISVTNDFYTDPEENRSIYNRFRFANPTILPGLKALKGPDYELLPHATVKPEESDGSQILSAEDKLNDEKYSYPLNPNFPEGILDIKSITVHEADSVYTFKINMRNLFNPDWHREYGYQLTLIAMMISGEENLMSSMSPINSKFKVPVNRKYSRCVIVGGGLEIRDQSGKVLAAYIPKPEDIENPLGDVKQRIISFSIPKRLIGKLTNTTKITLLSGAQDDHGGAGTGVFRMVGKLAEEWSGGGRKNESEDLVYDILMVN